MFKGKKKDKQVISEPDWKSELERVAELNETIKKLKGLAEAVEPTSDNETPSRVVSVRIPFTQYDTLYGVSEYVDYSISDLVRMALTLFIGRLCKEVSDDKAVFDEISCPSSYDYDLKMVDALINKIRVEIETAVGGKASTGGKE